VVRRQRDFVAVANQRDRVTEIRDRTVDAREAKLDDRERHLDARAAELGGSEEGTDVSAPRAEAGAARSQARQSREKSQAKRTIEAADRQTERPEYCPGATGRRRSRGGPAAAARLLSAGRGRPARTPFGFLVGALPVVASTEYGASCMWLVASRLWWRVGGTRDMPIEVLFPQGRERFEVGSSGWSRVLGVDAVGAAPHCNFADEYCARVASRWCPDWRAVTLAGVVLDLVGEVGD
jgi:hypothetical protein